MYLNLLSKINKRIIFEYKKKEKKLKHIIFKEWVNDTRDGKYDEKRIITNSLDKLCQFYESNCHDRNQELIDADKIIQGKYNLLYFNNDINIVDWNTDHESGHVYPIKYYGDIKYIVNDNKTDVKNVWELSRFHHVVIVAKAYTITRDEKYYKYYKKSILSWLSSNPNGKSVNWTCNMEVAIRVVNLIISYDLVKERLLEDIEFMELIKASIYYHNKHIYENLENYSDKRNNHYLSNLMGLLISSKFLENKNIAKYKKYQKFAKLELQSEIDKQIYDDGVTYEISTSYQKLVFEILLLSFILGQSDDNVFENKYFITLKKMSDFLKLIQSPDGSFPLIGDNDSGNIVVFNNYFDVNRSNLQSIINLNDYYLNLTSNINSSLTSYIGENICGDYNFESLSLSYRNSGYYILENNIFKVILLCGPLSMKGQGGHSHNDQLSFVLSVNGNPVFIDPGTITYTGNADLRNYSRQTSSHNTVQIDDEEQNLIGNDLFAMTERTHSNCTKFSDDEFSGFHEGFIDKYDCIHRRQVKIESTKILFMDSLTKKNDNELISGKINLVLSENVQCFSDKGLLHLRFGMTTLFTNIKFSDCIITETLASRRYGHYYKTKKLTFSFTRTNELIMKIK